jgi:hypothetical protein
VWSGWIGIAQRTGFGLVSPLPGIWPSLHLDTTITLPVGVEAYAAYALRAWLSGRHEVSPRTRRFAKWSAICSFALGMAGQVAYHLLAQAGTERAPWAITTIVSCLPVLVLGMGTALAHMLRADASDSQAAGPATAWSQDQAAGNRSGPDQDTDHGSGPPRRPGRSPRQEPGPDPRTTAQEPQDTLSCGAAQSGVGGPAPRVTLAPATPTQRANDADRVGQRPGQPVQARHDQGVAGPQVSPGRLPGRC